MAHVLLKPDERDKVASSLLSGEGFDFIRRLLDEEHKKHSRGNRDRRPPDKPPPPGVLRTSFAEMDII